MMSLTQIKEQHAIYQRYVTAIKLMEGENRNAEERK